MTPFFKKRGRPDYLFIIILILLVIFGLVMLTSVSSDLGKIKFNDSYYYLKHQLSYGLLFGFIGFLVGSFVYYRKWEKLAPWFLIINIVFLLLVFSSLGISVKGSERWINLGFLTFQPGEFLKLTFLIYLAAWLGKNQMRSKSFYEGFLPFLILSGVVAFLLFIQPATTTAVVILAASLLVYFSAGAKIRFIIGSVILGLAAVAFLVYLTPYRHERILGFLNPEEDVLGRGYHLNQALIAIGSGGLTGVGYGQSTTKLNYLPEPIGDSIFAVIAEELGFIGSILLIILFLVLIWRSLVIAKRAPDIFGRSLAIGFASLIGVQTFINIAAISGLIPLTGVPLPFISYGGTALAVYLTMAGIAVNISKYG